MLKHYLKAYLRLDQLIYDFISISGRCRLFFIKYGKTYAFIFTNPAFYNKNSEERKCNL